MSSLVITRTVRKSGTPIDVSSAVLRSADGTYGIRRKDTLEVVVAAGTAMTHVATGVYSYTIADAEPATYQYAMEVIINGQTIRFTDEATVAESTLVSGLYITSDDLQIVIPSTDYLDLFDRNKDGVVDPEIISAAIGAAEGDMHARLARRYQVPLDPSDVTLMAFLRPVLVTLAWYYGHPRKDVVSKELLTAVQDYQKMLDECGSPESLRRLPASGPIASAPSEISATIPGDPGVML